MGKGLKSPFLGERKNVPLVLNEGLKKNFGIFFLCIVFN